MNIDELIKDANDMAISEIEQLNFKLNEKNSTISLDVVKNELEGNYKILQKIIDEIKMNKD